MEDKHDLTADFINQPETPRTTTPFPRNETPRIEHLNYLDPYNDPFNQQEMITSQKEILNSIKLLTKKMEQLTLQLGSQRPINASGASNPFTNIQLPPLKIDSSCIGDFESFLSIDQHLASRSVKCYSWIIKAYLKKDKKHTKESIREYLKTYLEKDAEKNGISRKESLSF
ncbi:MAG: hypothetical protein ACYCQJ_06980 [Nitrososphaerales archaeon]